MHAPRRECRTENIYTDIALFSKTFTMPANGRYLSAYSCLKVSITSSAWKGSLKTPRKGLIRITTFECSLLKVSSRFLPNPNSFLVTIDAIEFYGNTGKQGPCQLAEARRRECKRAPTRYLPRMQGATALHRCSRIDARR